MGKSEIRFVLHYVNNMHSQLVKMNRAILQGRNTDTRPGTTMRGIKVPILCLLFGSTTSFSAIGSFPVKCDSRFQVSHFSYSLLRPRQHKRLFAPGRANAWKRCLATNDSETVDIFQIGIEYNSGRRWSLRGFWYAQELLTTFADENSLACVTVTAKSLKTAGGSDFVVSLHSSNSSEILWKQQAGNDFPDTRELKQRVRDRIDPSRFLGHSDTTDRREQVVDRSSTKSSPQSSKPEILNLDRTSSANRSKAASECLPRVSNAAAPHLMIYYCTGCRWLLRAAYLAQEMSNTLGDLSSITLAPSRPPAKGGSFVVWLDDAILWDRATEQRFPEPEEIEQCIRRQLRLDQPLTDARQMERNQEDTSMDEDEAAEARAYFGVM